MQVQKESRSLPVQIKKKNAALIHANKPDPASGGCKKKISIYYSFAKYKHGTVVLKILRMCRIKKMQ